MDGRLIFLHHMWRSMAAGRFGEGERRARSPFRKDEGTYDPEVLGRTVKKSLREVEPHVPVLKLTQVGETRSLRRSGEHWLRNSAN